MPPRFRFAPSSPMALPPAIPLWLPPPRPGQIPGRTLFTSEYIRYYGLPNFMIEPIFDQMVGGVRRRAA